LLRYLVRRPEINGHVHRRLLSDRRSLDSEHKALAFWPSVLWKVFTSASPRNLDSINVDLFHSHHGVESTLSLTATGSKRIG